MPDVFRTVDGPGISWDIEVSVWESEICHVVIREARVDSLEEPKVYDLEVPYLLFTGITEAIQEGFESM